MNTETILLITIVVSIVAIVTLALHPKVAAHGAKPAASAEPGRAVRAVGDGLKPAGSISLTAITAAPSLEQVMRIHQVALEQFEDAVLADALVAGTNNQHHASLVLAALEQRTVVAAERA